MLKSLYSAALIGGLAILLGSATPAVASAQSERDKARLEWQKERNKAELERLKHRQELEKERQKAEHERLKIRHEIEKERQKAELERYKARQDRGRSAGDDDDDDDDDDGDEGRRRGIFNRSGARDNGWERNSPFRTWDRNGNGVITREEWRGDAGSFDYYDRNRNGVVSIGEVRGRRAPVQRRW